MKYLITPHKLNNLDKLTLANGFIIGNSRFSARLTNSFNEEEINQIIRYANSKNKEVFLNFNKMFTDNDFSEFDLFLSKINLENLDGIILADIGVIKYLSLKGLENKLIYNPETLLTNQFDFNYSTNLKIKGAFVSKEISLNEIIEINQNKAYETFHYGHGHINMFYSKRDLITNFSEYYNLNLASKSTNFTITEPNRDRKSVV